ncbi:uncharacterized protein LOC131955787 isoform X11 [Physella acuta]|uniref:uncharacterized protein LOC131955787 isoform X11 n=1 Tax=Physella acuta TaxID=109671 RepID=UPI0027DD7A4C|nr:uncharacterized protein LOC131955787 isoform X11 [Physella acuta]
MHPLQVGAVVCLLLASVQGASINKSGLQRSYCSWGAQYWCSSPKAAELCQKTQWCTTNFWPYDTFEDATCKVTKKLLKSTRYLISESDSDKVTEYDIAHMVAKGCSLLKNLDDRLQCKKIASDQDVLLKLIEFADSKLSIESVAFASGACRKKIPYVENQHCTRCEDVVSTAQTYIRKFFTLEFYTRIFKKPCAKLDQGEELCEALAASKYDKFYNGLINASPATVCKGQNDCLKITETQHSMQSADFCSACKDVVAEIRALDRNQEVQAAIENLLKSVCVDLGQMEQMCDTVVEEGLQYFFEFVATEMEPRVVCENLDICNIPVSSRIVNTIEDRPILEEPKQIVGVPCIICQVVLKVLEDYLQNNSTEQSAEKYLQDFCNRLPPGISDECNSFGEKYLAIALQFLEAKLQPDLICSILGLCKNNSVSAVLDVQNKVSQPNDELCVVCKLVVTYINLYSKQNDSEAEIEKLLEKVCDILPASVKSQCDAMVTAYGPLIIQLLRQKSDPSQVCAALKFCSNSIVTLESIKTQPNDGVCDLCIFVVTYINTFLKKNDSEAEIEKLLEDVCDVLPSSIKSQCDEMVTAYGPLIIQFLLQKLSPQQVCAALKLCTNGTYTVATQTVSQPQSQLCDMCKLVVTYIDTYLKQNVSEAKIEEMLNKLCSFLPSAIQQECNALVTQYTPTIIQLLLSKLDPSQVCAKLKFCTSSTVARVAVEKPTSEQPKSQLCDMCKLVVTYIDTYLKQNVSEAKIEEMLDKLCSFLPSAIQQECNALVTQYTPTIIQLLLSKLDPSQVCAKLNFCTNSTVLVEKPTSEQPKSQLCDMCKLVVTYIDTYLKQNVSEAKIEEMLDKLCSFLPSAIQQECNALVTQYTPTIIQLLLSKLDPSQVCAKLNFCTNSTVTRVAVEKPISEQPKSQLCDMCKLVVTYIDTYLKQNVSEAKIEEMLDKLCSFLPSAIQQECNALVTQYTPTIIQLLLSKLDPSQVCAKLKFCTSSTVARVAVEKPTSEQPKSQLCDMCKLVVTYIDTYLKQNVSEAKIEEMLDKLCSFLPSAIQQECNALVTQYTPTIIQLLLSKLDPSQVCAKLKFCTSSTVAQVAVEKPTSEQPKSQLCDMCKLVVTYIDTYLKQNVSEAKIEEMLDKLCSFLPSAIQQECNALVTQYTPTIIQLLLSKLDPSQVCAKLNFCTNSTAALKQSAELSLNQPNGELCDLCKYVVTYIDTYLQQNASEAEIEALLEKVCSFLPASIQQQCDSLVATYAPKIIELLLQKLTPSEVCAALKLCDTNRVMLTLKPAVHVNLNQPNGEMCDLCKYVVTYINTYLQQNASEAEIEKMLEHVCDLLPESIKSECDSMVSNYAPLIIQYLLQKLSPSQVCAALKFCTNSPSIVLEPSVKSSGQPNGELCELCKYIVTYIYNNLKENSSEAEIEAILEKVCDIVPSVLWQKCDSLVTQYAPEIIQLLLKKLDPSQLCSEIGLCVTSQDSSFNKNDKVKSGLSDSDNCDICQYLITYLRTFVEKNSTADQIQATLDEACGILPDKAQAQCEDEVAKWTPEALQFIISDLMPRETCIALNLCQPYKTEAVLKSDKQQKVNDAACVLCEYVIQVLDNFVAKNSTQGEIEAVLQKVCTYLPSSVSKECDSFVNTYGPLVVQLLIQELQPDQICQLLKLCKTQTKTVYKVDKVGDASCALCEYVMTQLDNILAKNGTQAQIEAALNKVCNFLPKTLHTECETFIKTYGPLILQLLVQELQPEQICTILKFCKPQTRLDAKVGDAACVLCEYVMTELDNILAQNTTEAQIEAALNKVCNFLPKTLQKECTAFVETYGPLVLQLLVQELQPQQICTILTLCKARQCKETVKAGPTCALCEFIITILDNTLSANSTENEIQAALDKVCDMLPETLKSQCQTVVEQYAPIIIHLLIQKMDPQQICTSIRLCANKTTQTAPTVGSNPVQNLKKQKTEICALCEAVMLMLENILKENATQTEIISALYKVCDLLPASDKQLCHQFLPMYVGYVVELIEDEIPPNMICTYIKICVDDELTVSKNQMVQASPKKGELCALCTYVIQTLYTMLEQNSSKQEIIAALDKVCNLLPTTIKDQCDSFVGLYLPYIVDLIVQGLTPDQICKKFGLCTASVSAVAIKSGVSKNEICAICIYVLEAVDQLLEENATLPQIEAVLDKVCDYIPPIKDQCEKFVALYAPYVVDLITKELSPQEICSLLGLCVNTTLTGVTKHKAITVTVKSDATCAVCELVLKVLETLVAKNTSVKQIESYLDAVCNVLPSSVKAECQSFVATYTPQLIYLLANFPPEQVCILIKACSAPPMVKKPLGNGPSCPICELVMQQVEKFIGKNSTQKEVELVLDVVCELLPATVKKDCEQYVDMYTPVLVQLLLQISPDQICTYLKFCRPSTTVTQPTVRDIQCTLCKLVMEKLKSLISDKSTQAEIQSAMKKVCHLLPASMQDKCAVFVETFGPMIIQFILAETNPSDICAKISLCTAQLPPQKKLHLPDTWKEDNLEDCTLCKFIMEEVQGLLKEPFVEAEVQDILTKVCSSLPSNIVVPCRDLVYVFAPNIVDFISKGLSPIEFCQFIRVCERRKDMPLSQTKPTSLTFLSEKDATTTVAPTTPGYLQTCSLCKFALYDVQNAIETPFWQNETKTILYTLCTYVQSGADACKLLVDMNINYVISEITGFSFPIQFCQKIDFCEPPLTGTADLSAGNPECDVCKVLVQLLDSFLQQNMTVSAVEKVLNAACDALIPAPQRAQCEAIVRNYTPILMQLVAQLDDPTKACKAIRLCPNTSRQSLYKVLTNNKN